MHRTLVYITLTCLLLSTKLYPQADESFRHNLVEEKKPWTNKDFYNNPDNFQFAIVSDRTGGHRAGVFGKGLEKINKLYPEFVMSVGDLIEGYTRDTTVLNAEWKEFHGILDSLNFRFFYAAGNHDYTNPVMARMWQEQFGRDYYHFIYKNVLFLVANSSNGEGSVIMNDDQIAYLKKAIADNPDVRWTMLFLHHPMWAYGDMNGYNEVEQALKGRKYTVFAGHTHRYMFQVRNDRNHYLLATTGGGSSLRGPSFGEFDHISWVTLTEEGPKVVNLALSGILDDDISTETSREEARELIDASNLKTLVLSKGEERKVVLVLENSSDRAVHFEGRLFHHHQVMPDSSTFKLMLSPGASEQVVIRTRPVNPNTVSVLDPLELDWKMGYEVGFMEPDFSLSGVERIDLNTPMSGALSLTEQDVFLDELTVRVEHPYREGISARYTADGTSPVAESNEFPDEVKIRKSTPIKVLLADSDGFVSPAVGNMYRKVKPLKAIRARNLTEGFAYSYYEGNFQQVPDFEELGTPVKKGVATTLTPAELALRPDHFAIQYSGYFEVPQEGIFKFYLRSDDGSKLYIDDELVVDNDGSHDTRTRSGYVALRKGWYPFRIDYFEDYMGERLWMWYELNGERFQVKFWH